MPPPATAPEAGELVQFVPSDVSTLPAVPADVKPVPPLPTANVADNVAALPVVF